MADDGVTKSRNRRTILVDPVPESLNSYRGVVINGSEGGLKDQVIQVLRIIQGSTTTTRPRNGVRLFEMGSLENF